MAEDEHAIQALALPGSDDPLTDGVGTSGGSDALIWPHPGAVVRGVHQEPIELPDRGEHAQKVDSSSEPTTPKMNTNSPKAALKCRDPAKVQDGEWRVEPPM